MKRLALCGDLQEQLDQAKETCEQAGEARDLLEAKLACMMLSDCGDSPRGSPHYHQHESFDDPINEQGCASRGRSGLELVPLRAEAVVDCAGDSDVDVDAATLERHLRHLTEPSQSAAAELELQKLSAGAFHALLAAAASQEEGASAVVQQLVKAWVRQLVSRDHGSILCKAVREGSAEVVSTLLSLGGSPTVVAALRSEASSSSSSILVAQQGREASADGSPDLLQVCVQHGTVSMLQQLLDNLRGAGDRSLGSVRAARNIAAASRKDAFVGSLTAHLMVELSLLGNTQYRNGDFEGAIGCYEEAISLYDEPNADKVDHETESFEDKRDNLVRLRYNLARALHRTERWTDARNQASAVIVLDPIYMNAYVLRAQAAMAAWDWSSAVADWNRLLDITRACSLAGRTSALTPGTEAIETWMKKREECMRQLNLTHYDALEVSRLAGTEAVERAYKELARKWRPDKHHHRPRDHQDRAARRLRKIQEAYEILSDSTAKRVYDAKLLDHEARPLTSGRRNDPDTNACVDGGRPLTSGSAAILASPGNTAGSMAIGTEPPVPAPA